MVTQISVPTVFYTICKFLYIYLYYIRSPYISEKDFCNRLISTILNVSAVREHLSVLERRSLTIAKTPRAVSGPIPERKIEIGRNP